VSAEQAFGIAKQGVKLVWREDVARASPPLVDRLDDLCVLLLQGT
jgi:hypothetical protein